MDFSTFFSDLITASLAPLAITIFSIVTNRTINRGFGRIEKFYTEQIDDGFTTAIATIISRINCIQKQIENHELEIEESERLYRESDNNSEEDFFYHTSWIAGLENKVAEKEDKLYRYMEEARKLMITIAEATRH